MSLIKTIDFKSLGDERGDLVSLEGNKEIPFDIKRVYYLFGTEPCVSRGFHAHKNLQQVAICVKGSCTFVLDDGNERTEVLLNSPLKGLYIDSLKWREMHNFSDDCVLMVLADSLYEEADYIRDYGDFLCLINK
jgi:dTDP-4-dehydrorhamnose 3,5-epimerase-like enzyme